MNMTSSRRWTLAAFAVGFLVPSSVAAERLLRINDSDVTRYVEQTLAREPSLRGTKLLVSVVDGVAVVGGPVSNFEQQQRLKEVVQQVPGVRETKLSTWIPRVDAFARAVDTRPTGRVVSQRAELPPMLMEPIVQPAALPSAYSPLPPPAPPAPQGPPEYPTIPPPAVPVVPKQDVAAAVEEVRLSDNRYRALTTDVQAGVVTIRGQAADIGDAWELAKVLRKVPGIDRVSVGAVRPR